MPQAAQEKLFGEWNDLDMDLNHSQTGNRAINAERAFKRWCEKMALEFRTDPKVTLDTILAARTNEDYNRITESVPEFRIPRIYRPGGIIIAGTLFTDEDRITHHVYSFMTKIFNANARIDHERCRESIFPVEKNPIIELPLPADFRVQFPIELMERADDLEANHDANNAMKLYRTSYGTYDGRPVMPHYNSRSIEVSYDTQYRHFREPPKMHNGRLMYSATGNKMMTPSPPIAGEKEIPLKQLIDWDNETPVSADLESLKYHQLLETGKIQTVSINGRPSDDERRPVDYLMEHQMAKMGHQFTLMPAGHHLPKASSEQKLRFEFFDRTAQLLEADQNESTQASDRDQSMLEDGELPGPSALEESLFQDEGAAAQMPRGDPYTYQ